MSMGNKTLEKLAHYTDREFTRCRGFAPELVARLPYFGFLPMAVDYSGIPLMFPKTHKARSVLEFKDLHIPKNIWKKSKRFQVRWDLHTAPITSRGH